MDKIMPEKNKSISKGGIAPLGAYKNSLIFWQIEALGEKQVKGRTKPIRIYRVIGSSNRRTRFDVSAEADLRRS